MNLGGGVGSIWGAFSSTMDILEKNDTIEKQQKMNIKAYKAQEIMTKFAQSNNIMNAKQIQSELASEKSKANRDIEVQENKAISKETIRRGEGITAGASVVRSVDEVIKKGRDAKNNSNKQFDDRIYSVERQVIDTNSKEQIRLANSYNNMVAKNDNLQQQKIGGIQATLQIASAAYNGMKEGEKLYDEANQGGKADKFIKESINYAKEGIKTIGNNIAKDFNIVTNTIDDGFNMIGNTVDDIMVGTETNTNLQIDTSKDVMDNSLIKKEKDFGNNIKNSILKI